MKANGKTKTPESYARSTIQTLTATALILGCGLLTSVLLSRLLGPAGRGEVAAVLLWPTLFVYFASMGLMPALLYFRGVNRTTTGELWGTTFVLALAQSTVAMAIGYAVMPFLLKTQSPDVVRASTLFLWLLPLSLVSQYSLTLLQALLRSTLFNLFRVIIPLGYLVGCAALHWMQALNVWTIVYLQLGLNGVVLLTAATSVLREPSFGRLRFDRKLASDLLSYGMKVFLGDVSQGLNLRLDQGLLAAWLPPTELGLYVVAVSASSPAQVLGAAIRMSAQPRLSAATDDATRSLILLTTFRRFLSASIVAGILLIATMPILLPRVFGASFARAVWPAQILAVAAVVVGAKDVLSAALQGFGRPWLSSRAELWSAGVTLISLAVLLPVYGIVGAAFASLLAYASQLWMVAAGLHREFGIPWSGLFNVRKSDWQFLQRSPVGGQRRRA